MADEADHAQRIAEDERERLVGFARGQLEGRGVHDCVDCGRAIPAARREALPHATRCIDCQEAFESGTPRLRRAG